MVTFAGKEVSNSQVISKVNTLREARIRHETKEYLRLFDSFVDKSAKGTREKREKLETALGNGLGELFRVTDQGFIEDFLKLCAERKDGDKMTDKRIIEYLNLNPRAREGLFVFIERKNRVPDTQNPFDTASLNYPAHIAN